MNILVTNDDGVNAPGLWVLAEVLSHLGKVTIVAPDREQSGIGPSLSLAKAIRVHQLPYTMEGIQTYTVEGTPGDAVILGLAHVMKDEPPDLVVSGVNQGHNTGEEMLFSGTVGAAWHARQRGVPAIAVSVFQLDSTQYAVGARIAAVLARMLYNKAVPSNILYNVNIPHCELPEIKGVHLTRPCVRSFADEVREEDDGRNKRHYYLVRKRNNVKVGRGTDLWAIRRKYISVTLLDNRLAPLRRRAVPVDFCEKLFAELTEREWPTLVSAIPA